jgi:hypothetical protein
VSLYSIRYARHGKDLIRVGHDEVLRWYMSLDGKKWTPVVARLQAAQRGRSLSDKLRPRVP